MGWLWKVTFKHFIKLNWLCRKQLKQDIKINEGWLSHLCALYLSCDNERSLVCLWLRPGSWEWHSGSWWANLACAKAPVRGHLCCLLGSQHYAGPDSARISSCIEKTVELTAYQWKLVWGHFVRKVEIKHIRLQDLSGRKWRAFDRVTERFDTQLKNSRGKQPAFWHINIFCLAFQFYSYCPHPELSDHYSFSTFFLLENVL